MKSDGLIYKLYKITWVVVWTLLVRPFPRRAASKWEILLLRLFGAKIGKHCRIYSSAKIHIPYNLLMEDGCTIADRVHIQNTALITLKKNSLVSQGSYLCAGTHDYTRKSFGFIRKPIIIGAQAWITAECFIGPGVHVGEGAVVGARAVVFKDVEPWTVVGGNPARFIKKRVFEDDLNSATLMNY